MALPYDAIAPAAGVQPRSMMRMRAVAAVVAIAMVGCVALLGAGESLLAGCACCLHLSCNVHAHALWVMGVDRTDPIREAVRALTSVCSPPPHACRRHGALRAGDPHRRREARRYAQPVALYLRFQHLVCGVCLCECHADASPATAWRRE